VVQTRSSETAEARNEVAQLYQEKTSTNPYQVPVSDSIVRKLRDLLVPNIFASKQALLERYTLSAVAVEQLRHQLEVFHNEHIKNCHTIARIQKEKLDSDQRAQSDYSIHVETANAQHRKTVTSVKARLVEAEALGRTSQMDATKLSIWRFPDATYDDSPEQWSVRRKQVENEKAKAEDKLEFLARWRQSIEGSCDGLLKLYLDSIQAFFSTCVGLGSWKAVIEKGADAFDLVIIDEAAHATLTETLIPLCHGKRALLIGDEMQLPPAAPMDLDCKGACGSRCTEINTSNAATSAFNTPMSPCWLERSAFEWLVTKRPELPRVILNRQFRMHVDIADFVASVFYPEGLSTGVARVDRELRFGEFTKPVCLISTTAFPDRREEKVQGLRPGYRNTLEARLVRRILKQAETELDETQDFGVITPYAHQVTLLRQELRAFTKRNGRVKLTEYDIASVDKFQGSERDVMIISFVRSPHQNPHRCSECQGQGVLVDDPCKKCGGRGYLGANLEFVRDLRRLNVAFSRARKMLILVGDIEALTSARYGQSGGAEVLKRFHDYTENKGKVLRVWEELPPSIEQGQQ